MIERHRALRRAALALYALPGARSLARDSTRSAIQHLPLSVRNRQRLYNFFADDTIPQEPASCRLRLPGSPDLTLRLDLRDDLSRAWYFWGYGGYERGTTRLIRKLLEPGACYFDIGTNIGYYAILAASLLRNRGSVHAFEPFSEARRWLSLNASLNGLDNLHIYGAAVADKDGPARLYLPADGAWTNASLVEGFTSQDDCINVEATRLDTFCAKHAVGPISLLRIDAEGAEAAYFAAWARSLRHGRRTLFARCSHPLLTNSMSSWRGRRTGSSSLLTMTYVRSRA